MKNDAIVFDWVKINKTTGWRDNGSTIEAKYETFMGIPNL